MNILVSLIPLFNLKYMIKFKKSFNLIVEVEDPIWRIRLKEDEWRHFELIKDKEPHYWSVHFKTGDTLVLPHKSVLTESQKLRLFEGTSRLIPKGDYLSTHGNITKGGIHGLQRFKDFGFKEVGKREVTLRDTGQKIMIPIYVKL